MKITYKIIFLFIFLTCPWIVIAQTNEVVSETKHFNPFKVKVLDQEDIFGVDLYWSDWYSKSKSVKTKGFSFGFNVNYYYDIAFTESAKSSFAIGIGYNLFNMHNQGRFAIVEDSITGNRSTQIQELSVQELAETKRNRIAINTIDIPIELRFRIGKKKNKFKIYPGVKIGYNFGLAYTRTTETGKTTINNFPDVNNWRIAPTLRIGFKDFFIFGSVDVLPLFQNSESTRFTPIRFGISFGG